MEFQADNYACQKKLLAHENKKRKAHAFLWERCTKAKLRNYLIQEQALNQKWKTILLNFSKHLRSMPLTTRNNDMIFQ
jgi:hypothetical protein